MDRRELAKAMGVAVAGAVTGSVGFDAKGEAPTNRVASILKMLEEGGGDKLYSADYVSHKPWDRAESSGAFDDLGSVFSNMRVTVVDAVESGDKVSVRWRLRGDFTGAFGGIKPTGRAIDVTGINIYRFVGDKIVESWGEVDLATLVHQATGGDVAEEECEEMLNVLAARS